MLDTARHTLLGAAAALLDPAAATRASMPAPGFAVVVPGPDQGLTGGVVDCALEGRPERRVIRW